MRQKGFSRQDVCWVHFHTRTIVERSVEKQD
jgi:hypothetical protein